MKTQLISYSYDPAAIRPGILHIGVGNFHRAHEAFYTHHLLEGPDQSGWGISGVMLLPSDQRLYKALKEQDNVYTLTVCGRDGHDEAYRVASLVELNWGVENPEAVLAGVALEQVEAGQLMTPLPGHGPLRARHHAGRHPPWYSSP